MAITGQVNTNEVTQSNGGKSYFWVYWEINKTNVANNKTTIYWSCGVYCGADFYKNAVKMNPVTINGTQVYGGGTYSYLDKGEHKFAYGYLDIYHNFDGTKQFTIGEFSGWLYGSGTLSSSGNSFWLETIPRASTPSCITYPNTTSHIGNLGDTITIHTNSASSSFRHNIFYKYWSDGEDRWIPIARNVQSNYSWTIPMELANRIPNGKLFEGKLGLDTYSGNITDDMYSNHPSFIGTKIIDFTVTVPDNNVTKPSIRECLIVPVPNKIEGKPLDEGLFVSKRTKVVASMKASPKYSSSLKEYGFTINGIYEGVACDSAVESSFEKTSNLIHGQGNIQFECRAKDSRGFWQSANVNQWFEAYDKPYIAPHTQNNSIVCARCDKNGVLKNDGTCLRLMLSKQWWPLSSKANQAKVWYKVTSSDYNSDWLTLSDFSVTDPSGIVNIDATITDITLDLKHAYNVEIWVEDSYINAGFPDSYNTYNFRIPMEEVTFHLKEGGGGAAFGEYATETNEVKIKKEWNLRYKGSIMTDFIVERGTVKEGDVTWTYEKWYSGVAKCWTSIEQSVSVTSGWGYLYESDTYYYDLPAGLFNETPCFFISLSGDAGAMLETYVKGSKTKSPGICAVRGNPGNVNLEISIQAIGTWKDMETDMEGE